MTLLIMSIIQMLNPINVYQSNSWNINGSGTIIDKLNSTDPNDYIYSFETGNNNRLRVGLAATTGNLPSGYSVTIHINVNTYQSGAVASGDLLLRIGSSSSENVATLLNFEINSDASGNLYSYILNNAERDVVASDINDLSLIFRVDNFSSSGMEARVCRMYVTIE